MDEQNKQRQHKIFHVLNLKVFNLYQASFQVQRDLEIEEFLSCDFHNSIVFPCDI